MCEGAPYLAKTPCQRMFDNGRLLEDPVGFHNCCEPDPIRQIEDDLDVLMERAEEAQLQLLCLIGGPEDATPQTISERWKPGGQWYHPKATKKAELAFNPGVKSRQAAMAKAVVRYWPAEREQGYRHITDLARVGLVFTDATQLRARLDHVLEQFDVISVRNYYQPGLGNLAGEK